MTVTVTEATPEHVPAIYALVDEMYRFYGATLEGDPEEHLDQVRQALLGDPPAASVLVALDGDQVVGIASCSFLFPAVRFTRSLYLKELYVTGSHRRSGVGAALMRAVFEVAAKHECSRVEWTTDTVNAGAQRFYAELGFQQVTTKLFFRADTAAMERSLG